MAGHIPGAREPLLAGQPARRRPLQAARGSCAPSSTRCSPAARRAVGAPVRLGRDGLPQRAGAWTSPGWPARLLYPGSWSEWSCRPDPPGGAGIIAG
ncbi:MAG: hypothetical protein MZW92_04345 [Comamonadaceae bacterium]|nr:hypothetical protein [Comamonadaceae bacterium]